MGDFTEVYAFMSKRYPNMETPDLKFLFDCADQNDDGRLSFYELMDMLLTVPAHKADATTPSFARPLVSLKGDEMKMMEEAQKEYEQDQERLLAKVNDLVKGIQEARDQDKAHKQFMEEHRKNQREFFAK